MGWLSKVLFNELVIFNPGDELVVTFEGFCDVAKIERHGADGSVKQIKFKKVEE